MAKKLLITFGCSWTFGVASGYVNGMSLEALNQIAWNKSICDRLSWRGKLCQEFDYENRNFSAGGSSNQKQFRLATEYFNSQQFQKDRETYSDIKVLWGITSTARNEVWWTKTNQYRNFSYTDGDELSLFFTLNLYDHSVEIESLHQSILHWNIFLSGLGVDNYWFDTFNTHDYHNAAKIKHKVNSVSWKSWQKHYNSIAGKDWPSIEKLLNNDWAGIPLNIKQEIHQMNLCPLLDLKFDLLDDLNSSLLPRFIGYQQRPCDLMSWLCIKNHIDVNQKQYHLSMWKIDDPRVKALVDKNLLNPFTHHPTSDSHVMIADFLAQGANFG